MQFDEKEITLDIEDEEELLWRIEDQITNIENEPVEIDFIRFYVYNMLGLPKDEDITKIVDFIDNEEDRKDFLTFLLHLRIMFTKYLGFNMFNTNDEEFPFDVIYNIYYTFVIDRYNTFANYLIGLQTEDNYKFKNRNVFTLEYCMKEMKLKNSIESEDLDLDIEKVKHLLTSPNALSTEDAKIDTQIINSTIPFKYLYRKAFMNEYYFNDIDNFMEFFYVMISAMGANEIYTSIYASMCKFEYSVDVDMFMKKYQAFLLRDSTIDKIEELYKQKLNIYKKSNTKDIK